jgi:dGTPase
MMPQRDDRLHPKDKPSDQRQPGQRDRDRILYTSAFRRLAGVTQVVAPTEGLIFHNRLTHTLEVGQIGRRLAEKLITEQPQLLDVVGGIDPDVVEAAALAHDLGHPPFGHVVEEELNYLVTQNGVLDGFEGNAQSFRIVTKLACRHEGFEGLNLTRATLNAILKYPWVRSPGKKKWGAYHTEGKEFSWARELLPHDEHKSAEAEIMDWADDVAYSVHDVEDFYRAGLIPLDRLIIDQEERQRFHEKATAHLRDTPIYQQHGHDQLQKTFDKLVTLFPINEPYNGALRQRSLLRSWTAGLVGRYINALRVSDPAANLGKRVEISPNEEIEVTMLKQLTWHYVIDNPALDTQQYGQRRVVRDLYNIYLDASTGSGRQIFPKSYQERLTFSTSPQETIRVIADLLASMTEQQLLNMHKRLTGISLGSVLDAINY